MRIKDILKNKSTGIVSIVPNADLKTVVSVLGDKKVGSLMVLDDQGNPLGIITERDIMNELSRNHGVLGDRKVSEVMTKDLICGLPGDDIDYIMGVMTQNRIRHLPIIEENILVGIISIGDVIKCQLEKTAVENHYLRDYIAQGG